MTSVALAMKSYTKRQNNGFGLEPEKSASDEKYAAAWERLNASDLDGAIAAIDDLLVTESQNPKLQYTRGVACVRAGLWEGGRNALSEYIMSVRAGGTTAGAPLANAHYMRALCMVKLGYRVQAVKELDASIAAGPPDEQATDAEASMAPLAVVARALLLQDEALAKQCRFVSQSEALAKGGVPSWDAPGAAAPSAAPTAATFDGPVWRIPVTSLEAALEKCAAAKRTALLLDPSEEKPVDGFFLYATASVIEAKLLVFEMRAAGVALDALQERLRTTLVHAMRWGHYLVCRMQNSAAAFLETYCSDTCFPAAVFDAAAVTPGEALTGPLAAVLRDADISSSPGGVFTVKEGFRVVVTSSFGEGNYAELLAPALPLARLQPVLCLGSSGATEVEGAHKPKGAMLQGDRTTLFLQS